jgi:hypothetical protein
MNSPLLAAAIWLAVSLVAIGALAGQQPDAEHVPGLTVRVYQVSGDVRSIPRLAASQTPNADTVIPTLDLGEVHPFPDLPAPILTHVRGYLKIVDRGTYRFRLTSDDGSRLLIANQVEIDHDGRHGATAKESGPVLLEAGLHALLVEHFDSGGRRMLRLEWKPPGAPEFSLITPEVLSTDADAARVTSPGVKSLFEEGRPGDGRPVEGVHPSFTLTPILPPDFSPKVGAMCFLPDGRLVVGTFSPLQRTETDLPDIESKVPDKLYALSNVTTGDPSKVQVVPIADGLFEPSGLVAVGDKLYVSHRCAISELTDTDGDGFFESRRDIASGWECWNYHQFTFGLLHGDGKLYAALSTAMAPPAWEGMGTNAGPNGPLRGCIIEADIASGTFSVIAAGTRTPNGIGWGPAGTMFYSDNQGVWMSTSQLGEVVPGRFFGHYNNTEFVPKLAERFPSGGSPSAWGDRLRAPTAIYLPQNELANSPSQPLLIDRGPYAGQMFVGEITAGGIRRVALEKVNGVWQGAAFRFTQGLSCGINRLAWGPDGALYAGGIGASGNWSWEDKRSGLDRLVPNDTVTFEMHSVSALADGFEIRFTKPVDRAWLSDVSNFTASQWGYIHTKEYGGPKSREQKLEITSAAPSADGLSVRLTIKGLRPDSCILLRTDPKSVDGDVMWSTEAWYTLNQIPAQAPPAPSKLAGTPIDPTVSGVGVGVPPPVDAAVLIGRAARNACEFAPRLKDRPTDGRSQADILAAPEYVEVGNGSGDLISRNAFGDCRLHVEWYSPPGGEGQMAGNSGVYLQERYEIQVLGTLAGDRALQANEAGAIYNLKPASVNASTGPGAWQAYDIWFRAPRFEDGKKVSNARITAYWNGILIHDDVEVNGPTGSAAGGAERSAFPMQVGSLRLQDHASAAEGPVRYRNVWIAPLDPVPSSPGPWRSLFDGESLEGWAVRGGNADFQVHDGAIVGTSRPNSPNTFLVSTQEYADYELLVEFKIDAEFNSGIQIRSAVDGGFANRDGRLMGFQVEIDPTSRAYTGGIYDEGRRGWIYPLIDNPAARGALKPDDWNQLRIVAVGPSLRTWLNGVPAADVFDAFDQSGRIALQVHSVGDRADELRARFRNIRIRELTRAP